MTDTPPNIVHENERTADELMPSADRPIDRYVPPSIVPSFFDADRVRQALESDETLRWTIEDHINLYHQLLTDDTIKPSDRLRALSQYEAFRAKLESDKIVRTMLRQTTTVDNTGQKTVEQSFVQQLRMAVDMTPASHIFQEEKDREQIEDTDGDDGEAPDEVRLAP